MPLRKLGRYDLLQKLGEGGMGEVYLARDPSLGRHVALKLLPSEMTSDPDRRRRLAREARAAAAVAHPNVTHVYEVGEADGTLFIAMEHVEGRTLAEVLAESPLPRHRVLQIAGEIADALGEAHARGVVHRDVKPGNVMLTSRGQVKVLDFGLARIAAPQAAASATTTVDTISRTEPGRVSGTLPYMSPEQALGHPLDERSDVFSFGTMLYEMVAGRRPFDASTPAGLLDQLLTRDPPPFATKDDGAEGDELWRITRKCLARDPEARYPSARDLLVDLRNLERQTPSEAPKTGLARRRRRALFAWGGAAALALAVAAGVFLSRGPRRIDSIAVLPLVNAGGDPEMEYLGEGLTDSLINSLAQVPDLEVRSRAAVTRFRGEQPDPQAAGEALRVEAVVLGRILARNDELSVSVELVDVADNRQIWGEQYRGHRREDLLRLQGDISHAIATKLDRRLTGEEERRVTLPPTVDPEAYDLYLRGREHWYRLNEDGYLKALDYYSQALERDPRFALAYTGMAEALILLGVDLHRPPRDVMPRARAAAEKALDIDPALPEAHHALAVYELFYGWDWPRAERLFEKALALRPHYADALHYQGHYLQAVGRVEEAVERTRQALDLDPLSLVLNGELGYSLYVTRRHDLAIAEYRRTLELNPRFVFALWLLTQALEQQGRHEEAMSEVERALEIEPDWLGLQIELGCAHAAAGHRQEALAIVDELRTRAARDGTFLDPGYLSWIPAQLGEKDMAFALLDEAIEKRSSVIVWLRAEPKFDNLRSDDRFAQLLARIQPESSASPGDDDAGGA